MKIEIAHAPSHSKLVLRGEFGTEESVTFLAEIEGLLAEGCTSFVVLLRYVKYINSTALGAVVRAQALSREAGGQVVIARPSPVTRDVITTMGLDAVLPMFDAEDDAVDYLQGESRAPAPTPTSGGTSGEPEPLKAMFSFTDERTELFPGRLHHGVGHVEHLDEHGLRFHWNPTEHDVDMNSANTMFQPGSPMQVKVQIKLIRKGYFHLSSTIDAMTPTEGGVVVVTANWNGIAAADREALERHAADLRFLREEAARGGA